MQCMQRVMIREICLYFYSVYSSIIPCYSSIIIIIVFPFVFIVHSVQPLLILFQHIWYLFLCAYLFCLNSLCVYLPNQPEHVLYYCLMSRPVLRLIWSPIGDLGSTFLLSCSVFPITLPLLPCYILLILINTNGCQLGSY